ncbi:MAG: hypothetical protein IBJ10_09040 [Phycisphaerales bacterium]|nr:hypothetical protein [Phycisphaerales bacterium]
MLARRDLFWARAAVLSAAWVASCAASSPFELNVANGADTCAAAPAISGDGVFSFNNTGANTDGPSHGSACTFSGDAQIWKDLWWRWTAPCDGPVTIETCNLTLINTKIAVYAPLALCPPLTSSLLTCNDDACGVRSSVTFVAIAGQEYLLRIGVFNNGPAGSGQFRITCATNGVCTGVTSLNQAPTNASAPLTSASSARVADNFSVIADGFIASLCWRGGATGTGTDSFRITYWTDVNGKPGVPHADFRQSTGAIMLRKTRTGQFLPGGAPEHEYHAAHAAVPIEGGRTYWIEIRNGGVSTWAWAAGTGGDGVCLYDTTPANTWGNALVRPDRTWRLAFDETCLVDTNGDGVIDFADLNNILSSMNTVCP